jgi:predicted SAM-dependent methyltransferase
MPGWVNIDVDERDNVNVYAWDLRCGLPFVNESIEAIFAEHFIEHVTLEEAQTLAQECKRVLEPGGVLRLSTPDLAFLVDEYQAKRIDEWTDMRWEPNTPCQMLNEAMRLWGHLFVYDRAEISDLLRRAGFQVVYDVAWRESAHPILQGVESRPYHHEIIVEAIS